MGTIICKKQQEKTFYQGLRFHNKVNMTTMGWPDMPGQSNCSSDNVRII